MSRLSANGKASHVKHVMFIFTVFGAGGGGIRIPHHVKDEMQGVKYI